MYKALIILCAISLIIGRNPAKNPGILGRLKTLDLNTFDAFQYALARKTLSLANSIRKIHTGNLNLNMLGFLVGFIICLLFLLGFAFF